MFFSTFRFADKATRRLKPGKWEETYKKFTDSKKIDMTRDLYTQRPGVQLRGLGINEKTRRQQFVINCGVKMEQHKHPERDIKDIIEEYCADTSQSVMKYPWCYGRRTQLTSTSYYNYFRDRCMVATDDLRVFGWRNASFGTIPQASAKDLTGEAVPLQMLNCSLYAALLAYDFPGLWKPKPHD